MARKSIISLVCIGTLVLPALARSATPPVRGQTLMPNVVYSRQVEFTAHGPVVEHVIVAPKPTGLYSLKTILSNNAVQGTERLTSMERRVSGDATVAGIDGGSGLVLRSGILDVGPSDGRSSVGVDADGTLHVDRVALAGTWQGSGQRRIVGVNEAPRQNRAPQDGVYRVARRAAAPTPSFSHSPPPPRTRR